MKRKSEQIAVNVVRNLKKNKTQGFTNNRAQNFNWQICREGQVIVTKILREITENVEANIKNCAHSQLLDSIVESCFTMSEKLSSLIFPQIQNQEVCQISADIQPARVSYDPICGFDKLITIKNDTFPNQETQFVESKSKAFGVFQSPKKQQSIPKTSMSSIVKLVPLDNLNPSLSKTKSQKQNEKQQSFYRDRIYESSLPSITPQQQKKPQKTKITKTGFDLAKQSQVQDCMFDYKGQKCSLGGFSKISPSNSKQSSNNVLRTTYRVIQNSNQQKKKATLQKGTKTRMSNLTQVFKIGKQVIKNPNLRHEEKDLSENSLIKYGLNSSQAEQVKNLLEASFRQKQGVFRPIQRTGRPSKIL